MDLGLQGRRALVMGGSRGLGKAVAKALIAEGVRVAICARDAGRLAATAAEIGAKGLVSDLSAPGAAASVVRDAQSRLGQLDVLVVNTGGPPPGLFAELSDDRMANGLRTIVDEQRRRDSRGAARNARARVGAHHPDHVDCSARAGRKFDAFQFPARRSSWARQHAQQGGGRGSDHRQRADAGLYVDRAARGVAPR